MTVKESYDYMYAALLDYYNKTHNDELGGMLGGFECFIGDKPFDPAAWHDWLKSVRTITPEDVLSETQVQQAIISLLKDYNDNHGFNLKEVINHFQKAFNCS